LIKKSFDAGVRTRRSGLVQRCFPHLVHDMHVSAKVNQQLYSIIDTFQ